MDVARRHDHRRVVEQAGLGQRILADDADLDRQVLRPIERSEGDVVPLPGPHRAAHRAGP
jgi:hypothetical protein